MVPFIDDGAPAAVIYADAFYQPGETRHKAGHFPAEVNIKPGTRGMNGWGYVVRIGDAVFYDCGTAPAEFLDGPSSTSSRSWRRGSCSGDISRQTAAEVAGVHRRRRPVGPHKGIRQGRWSTAALCEWLPDFRRVPSKANVSDAVSRGDLSMAVKSGWTRARTPTESILKVLTRAVADLHFATQEAADELANLAI